MQFAHPHLLWLALLAPAAAFFLWRAGHRRRDLMSRFIPARLLPGLTAGFSASRRQARIAMLTAATLLLALAAAQPQWGFAWEEAKQRGLDIVVAVDTSRSMLTEDIKPNRLARAKLAALDLMLQARSDRLGLVTFAGTAFLQCPLTLDEDAFRQSINILDVDILPQGGTALAEAIEAASAVFKDAGDNHKVLVIFTDGEDHEPGALEAAEKAAQAGLRIFTIGVGTPEGEMVRLTDARGHSSPLTDDSGQPVHSRLNQQVLQEIAQKGNGFYLPLTGARTVETLYERGLAPLPKTDFAARLIKRFHERFQWPLGLALLLLILETVLPDRAGSFCWPWKKSAAARVLPLVLALAAATTTATASPAKASKLYEQKRYQAALEEYQRLLVRQPEDARLHFNAGDAAYQAGDFDQAARQFSLALNAPKDLPLQERAYYNWGNALVRLGEQDSELDKRQTNWEQAMKQYESALKLDPQDADARFNRDLIKQKLEELKQQQQQSKDDQKQDQDKKDQQDQKDQKDQKDQSKQSDKKDQKQPDKSNNQDKKDQPKPDSQPQKQPNQDQKPDTGKPGQKPEDKKSEQGSAGKKSEPGQTNEAEEATSVMAVTMTPEQAMQLLEAQKGEEKALIFQPPETKQKSQERNFKNW